ncbi:YwiC-like protein [Paenibacillus tianmuensis]|uniref:YwiC-like protein n=1 Tax=Paenibacillus tianmuensis TaxID=624147 RepID=A0A1G4R872_9BACL|nr:YwiC-like family protein [Paenibacillus tianmuensis]SCW53083.1 YwiC-like protein [Paenibacillus tianmuensis]
MKKRSIVIPHEHGGWAMVSVPFLLGMFAGKPQLMHLPLFMGWLLLYLSSYPFLQSMKNKANRRDWIKWGTIYGLLAACCLALPLLSHPALLYFGPLLLVLLSVNIWHTRHKSERALINDLCAVLLFSIGGAAAYLAGGGGWDRMMASVVLFCFLHFTSSVFFVKAVFRERENRRWVAYTRVYHGLLPFVLWAGGYPWMILAYAFSAARAFAFAGKPIRPWKAGIIEIVGAVQFVILSAAIIQR